MQSLPKVIPMLSQMLRKLTASSDSSCGCNKDS